MKRKIIAILVGLMFLAGCAWYVATEFFNIRMGLEGGWSLVLMLIGFISLFNAGGRLFGVGLMLVGGGVLIKENGWFNGIFESVSLWNMVVAVLLFIIGLAIIGSVFKFGGKKHNITVNCDSEATAIFSSRTMSFAGQEFKGTEVTGVFGELEIDLRDAIINEDCEIKAASVFGSVVIYKKAGVNYEVNGAQVFGSVSGGQTGEVIHGAPTVTVDAASVFGSIELR